MLAPLEAQGYEVVVAPSTDEASPMLRRMRPNLLIVAARSGGSTVPAARELGIPILEVYDRGSDLPRQPGGGDEPDDWVLRSAPAEELAARVERLLRKSDTSSNPAARPASSPIDVGKV